MRRFLALLLLLPALLLACGGDGQEESNAPGQGQQTTLLVSAAANLADVLPPLLDAFRDRTGIAVQVNFGNTAQLAAQIERGAPVDLFLAADRQHVETLAAKGLVLPDTVRAYARGKLVLWTRADSGLTLSSLEELASSRVGRIAIANPDQAPYGAAARQALRRLGLWDALQGKLVIAETIQQAFQYARSGNADAAFTALSLVINEAGNRLEVPPELYDPIDQTLAVVKGTPREAAARRLADFLVGPEAAAVWQRYGYDLPALVSR
ncbi:MAG: molybdate ABC transporter substrate-binding protein [Dehalococcoidia bacterium]|nr:molybdate ABC transporter substrate-binding protein [Dehalococcoidia bacterium]MDW8009085.1 molybdate ABC transporter substrate-binding protein [Chloroflexota bacterium]